MVKKKYLKGRSNLRRDKMLRARVPGKRIVIHSGKKKTVYYEYRRNRADLSRRTRL